MKKYQLVYVALEEVKLEDKIPRLRVKGWGCKDSRSYVYYDSGCGAATDYLGFQSSCLKCPFEECILEKNIRKSRVSYAPKQNDTQKDALAKLDKARKLQSDVELQ